MKAEGDFTDTEETHREEKECDHKGDGTDAATGQGVLAATSAASGKGQMFPWSLGGSTALPTILILSH